MIIFYNPDCSKCNEALGLLESNQCEVTIRNYLQDPPSVEELRALVRKLNCQVTDLVRSSEPLFMEKFQDKTLTEEQWLKVLSENPILIQRPIVVDGEKALIGRPPVLVLDLLKL
jgi:arsenate reductase (glutaredoxin)